MYTLDELFSQLLEKAKADGVITDNEDKLLHAIKIEGKEYDETLKKAKLDGIIDEEEIQQLINLKYELLKKSFNAIVDNGEIPEDIVELLTVLVRMLNKNAD